MSLRFFSLLISICCNPVSILAAISNILHSEWSPFTWLLQLLQSLLNRRMSMLEESNSIQCLWPPSCSSLVELIRKKLKQNLFSQAKYLTLFSHEIFSSLVELMPSERSVRGSFPLHKEEKLFPEKKKTAKLFAPTTSKPETLTLEFCVNVKLDRNSLRYIRYLFHLKVWRRVSTQIDTRVSNDYYI